MEPKYPSGGRHSSLELGRIANVGLERKPLSAGCADFLDEWASLVGSDVDEDSTPAERGKREGGRRTDASQGTSDQYNA